MITNLIRARATTLALALFTVVLCINRSARAQSNLVYVEIPAMLAAKPSTTWSEAERTHADLLMRQKLENWSQRLSLSAEELQRLDALVVFTHNGQALLPDLVNTQKNRATQAPSVTNELAFTFNSTNNPWTASELDSLRRWLSDFYPMAKAIYGDPAFNITVNVRKDPAASFVGLYIPSFNEILIRHSTGGNLRERIDVIAHEMLHAFHDDYLIGFQSYEEGLTRAAEVELFHQLPHYPLHWNANHRNSYDMFYDGLNESAIASKSENFGGALTLLRYQMAGYAWAKAYLENRRFFMDFNLAYYAETRLDPGIPYNPAKLQALAHSVMPTIEQQTFAEWYERQHVLNMNTSFGYILYQRINQYTIDYFHRDSTSGFESAQAGATVQWAVYDYKDSLLESGISITNSLGVASFDPRPRGYFGKIKVVVATTAPAGPLQEVSYRPYYFGTLGDAELGVFGVIPEQTLGTVTLRALDEPFTSATQTLINGAFFFSQFEKNRGRFELLYTAPNERQFQHYFTKDASHYFIDHVEPRSSTCSGSGDVNGDGTLTPGDAFCAFRIYLNNGQLPVNCDAPNFACEAAAADANCDGAVTPGDALAIFIRYVNGLLPEPCFAQAASNTSVKQQ